MFLGISEIRHDKARFVLIVAVIALVSYLTYFLTALAYGLATSYSQGIDKWQASGIVLQKDANDNIARSLLHDHDYNNVVADEKALLGVSSATVELTEKTDITLFGFERGSFISPNIVEGRTATGIREVIASDELKNLGLKIDDTLRFTGSNNEYKVVGFTDRATFQTAPIIYMDLGTWRSTAADLSGMTGMRDDSTVNAIITRGEVVKLKNSGMKWQSIRDFVFTLPGYGAQVATFGLMIGFLIFIASFVLAIFIYILTIQKKSIFGVLKAGGVPNKYISRSVKAQIVILVSAGMAVGLGLTLLTGWGLAGKVPFLVQPVFFAVITTLFLIFSAIGGIASVRIVTKIDPVEAIG